MRARRILQVIVLTTLLATLAADAPALATTRTKVGGRVNEIRRNHGLRRLDCTAAANRVAQRNSRQMAGSRSMFHSSNLYSRLRNQGLNPSSWGENVGYAPGWRTVVSMWMNSSGHRHNILSRGFRRCGVGASRASGRVWLTFVFYG